MYCYNKCCKFLIEPYIESNSPIKENGSNKKAGVFIFDIDKNKILLVQSRGNLWGIPKGTFEKDEDNLTCAVREVKEETGIDVNKTELQNPLLIRNSATYYYINKRVCDVNLQKNIVNNDANGIGWINICCLKEMITEGHMKLNHHCRVCIKHFLNINLPYYKKNS